MIGGDESIPVTRKKRSVEERLPRKVRSKIVRRPRIPVLPIVDKVIYGEDEADSSASCFTGENFGVLSFAGARGRNIPGEIEVEGVRSVTRWYEKQQQQWKQQQSNDFSTCSDFESKRSEVVEQQISSEISRSFAARSELAEQAVSTIAVSEASEGFPERKQEEKARLQENAPANSEFSCLESISKPEISLKSTARDDLDLSCSEELSSVADDSSSYYSVCNDEFMPSDSEFFDRRISGSQYYTSSDYSFSIDSGDQFSVGSGDSSTPLSYLPVFLELTKKFSPLKSPSAGTTKSGSHNEYFEDYQPMRIEDEDDEESYKMFRSRERRGIVLHKNAGTCCDLVIKQRRLMVNWIIEHRNARQLQNETLFLGVSLLDRVLRCRKFKTERDLQLLGIACITLATRIEENQPYNSIRQKIFTVQQNLYKRSEVVAMEWLVQDILEFKLLLPTTFNFLWFYLKAAKADLEVENLAKKLAVWSLLDHECLSFWPSTIAAGLVILASLATDQDHACHTVMEIHMRTKKDDLAACMQSLEWLVKDVLLQ